MALMTGNAFTMTIPQLDKTIKTLKEKLNEQGVKGNETLTTKVNNLIYDYTKAKNKILRYYEKTKYKHPELVVGKKNTLRVIDIERNKGNFKKAEKLANKEQKASYNVVDLMKDSKGLAIGLASSAVALGVANGISMAVAQKGIMTVLGEAIKNAFMTQPLTATLITAGLAIGGTALIVPKVSRSIQKIKRNKTMSREITNDSLNASVDMSNIDFEKADLTTIKETIKNNPALKDNLQVIMQNGNYSPLQQAILKQAQAEIALDEKTAERAHLAAEGQARLKADKYEEYVNEYESALAAAGGSAPTQEEISNIEIELKDNNDTLEDLKSKMPSKAPIAITESKSYYESFRDAMKKENSKDKSKATNLKKKTPPPTTEINKLNRAIADREAQLIKITAIINDYDNAKKAHEDYLKLKDNIEKLTENGNNLKTQLANKQKAADRLKEAQRKLASIGLDSQEKIDEALKNKELAGYAK